MNPGTTTQRSLTNGQRILMALVWLGAFALMFVVLRQLPNGDENPLVFIMILVFIGLAWFLTFRIATRAAGKPYTRITAPEGLRGEFSVRREWPLMLGFLTAMITVVCALGIIDEPPGSDVIWGWALTALIPLALYGFYLFRLRNRVVAFRIDDNQQVFIKRAGGDWTPLRIADYGRIISHTMSSSRYTVKAPSRIDFLDPLNFEHPVSIPLLMVRSRQYKTAAYGTIIDHFFRQQCQDAGFEIRPRGDGWIATPTRHL